MKTQTRSISELVRPSVRRLQPYRCARDTVLNGVLLDANESPFTERKGEILLNRYPDPNQTELRQALAGHLGLQPSQVLAGCGSDEVLDWIFKVFVQPERDRVAILEPTYGMYRVLADTYGVGVQEGRLGEESFDFDADRFLDEVAGEVKILFLCSPNNPTGNLLDRRQILRLCDQWPRLVVVDEAYIEFAGANSLAGEVAGRPNLLVLRTLSKAFGRAGIRLGYAAAHEEVISYLRKVKAPYNLNALTMREGVDCLSHRRSYASVSRIRSERERLAGALRSMPGIDKVYPSRANFVLFRCPGAGSVCRELLSREIVVRDRSSLPGLQDCVRVSVGTPSENDLFLRHLEEVLREREG